MQSIDLSGKRVLLTQASDFMGPALAEVFRECGADLISADGLVAEPDYPQRLLAESGAIDVLLLNLGIPAPTTAAPEVMDDEWRHAFSAMVDPLPRFARAVLPQMLARGSGKILLIGIICLAWNAARFKLQRGPWRATGLGPSSRYRTGQQRYSGQCDRSELR